MKAHTYVTHVVCPGCGFALWVQQLLFYDAGLPPRLYCTTWGCENYGVIFRAPEIELIPAMEEIACLSEEEKHGRFEKT
jgi:hypothetical protein